MREKSIRKRMVALWRILPGVLVLGLLFFGVPQRIGVAQAAPLSQDNRPPINPDGGGGGGGGGSGGGSGGEAAGGGSSDGTGSDAALGQCASVSGEIIDWGNGPYGDTPATLQSGSWQVSTSSASDGSYGFGGLGVGVAYLTIPRASGDRLQPVAQNAAIYLSCEHPTIANIGLSSVPTIAAPATIDIAATQQIVSANGSTRLTFTIENTLPTAISNVIVTSAIPAGLTALNVSSSVKTDKTSIQIVNGGDDGQIVFAYLDSLAAGAKETVFVSLIAIEDTPHTQAKTTATLFYREGIAHQASLDLGINGNTPVAATVIQASSSNGSGDSMAMVDAMLEEVREASLETGTSDQSEMVEVATEQADTSTESETATTTESSEAVGAETEDADSGTALVPPKEGLLPVTGQELPAEIAPEISEGEAIEQQESSPAPLIGIGLLLLAFVAYGAKSAVGRSRLN